MASKLEASGHIRRKPAPSDKRASIVELTDSGKALANEVKQLWRALVKETVTGLPAETVAELPGVLNTLTGNVDTRRPRRHTAAGTVGRAVRTRAAVLPAAMFTGRETRACRPLLPWRAVRSRTASAASQASSLSAGFFTLLLQRRERAEQNRTA